jgi:hypothetical protein
MAGVDRGSPGDTEMGVRPDWREREGFEMKGLVRKSIGGCTAMAMAMATVVAATAPAAAQDCGTTLEDWTRSDDKVQYTGTLSWEGEDGALTNVYFDSGSVDAHATFPDGEHTRHWDGYYGSRNIQGNRLVMRLRAQDTETLYMFVFEEPSCSVLTGYVDTATLSIDDGRYLGQVKSTTL